MGIENIILLVLSALMAILSIYVLLRNRNNAINISFFFMTIGAAIWISSNAVDYIYFSEFLTRITYVGAIVMVIGYYYFSWYFPYQIHIMNRTHHVIIFAMTLLLIIFSLFGGLIIKDVINQHKELIYGPIFPLYNIIFLLFWIFGLVISITKYRRSDGLHRWQLKNIIWVLFLAFIAGITTNLVLPWVFNVWNYGWVGPMFTMIFFAGATYILFKKNI
ncbi:MAG: histidine kinase N-terminal 7TM domain-containing protein [Patescibacteria group bacterium]